MRILSTAIIGLAFVGARVGYAERPPTDPLSWDQKIQGIMLKYCGKCHDAEKNSGGVNLVQDVDLRQILDHRETWETAMALIASEEMPPKEAPQPSVEDRELLVKFLDKHLGSLDCSTTRDPGKPILRRLNRSEYDLTIEDLIGLKLDLAQNFPPDESSYGFDNIGDALSFSPVQVEQYHSAAKAIIKSVIDCRVSNPDIYHRVFGDVDDQLNDKPKAAGESIRQFASQAIRRPITDDFLERLTNIYASATKAGETHETAYSHMVTAVLISPYFLIRIEQNSSDSESSDPYPIDDYELAVRLSYFLWSRPPDDELATIASQGLLQNEEQLEKQARRMLKDRRSEALVDHFFGQWLSLREIESYQPDLQRFPAFNERLRQAMKSEVDEFLTAMVQQDRPITDIIDADYMYVNEVLAKHYGLKKVRGDEFRQVALPDRRRGGLITSAALLMLQADPGRTNIPRRGNFVAGRILGDSPPPPPPEVPDLDESQAKDGPVPLRELLAQHRKNPECANCHAKIDPFGFALENFDAIGRWRKKDGPFDIDPRGELADGTKLNGIVGLKDHLLEQSQSFKRNLSKNLLIYALGRGVQGNDECVLREMLMAADDNGDRFSSLVIAIVKSFPFRHRRNPLE
jgi:hypothetical protein